MNSFRKMYDYVSKVRRSRRIANLNVSEKYKSKSTSILKNNTTRIKTNTTIDMHACTSQLSCIYLIKIDTVKHCKSYIQHSENLKNFEDKDYVFKFGLSDNIKRRLSEHQRSYGKWSLSPLSLTLFTLIPPTKLYDAEARLKHVFIASNMLIKHETYNELVVIPEEMMKSIKTTMTDIGSMYEENNKLLEETKQLMKNQIDSLHIEIDTLQEAHDTIIHQMKEKHKLELELLKKNVMS